MDPSQLNLPSTISSSSSSSTSSDAPKFGAQIIEPTKRRRGQGAKIRMVSDPSSTPCARTAIVLDKLPGLDLAQYVSGVTKAVPGAEIQWVDELQPSQVCLFLASQAVAESQHGQYLDIDGHRLRARPLTRVPLVPVLATNVLPFVSINEIANILLDHRGIEVKDWVYLEAEAASSSGALSFSRYLYVEPQDVAKFPAKIHGKHNNEWPYTIYFGSEEHWCAGCQRVGHSERNCDKEQLAKHIGLDQTTTIVVPSTKNDDITAPLPGPSTSTEQSGGVVSPIASTSTSESANNQSDKRLKSRLKQRKAFPLNTSEQGSSSSDNSVARRKIKRIRMFRSKHPQKPLRKKTSSYLKELQKCKELTIELLPREEQTPQ